ncbi:metallophosphoesterase, partial [bacterium]
MKTYVIGDIHGAYLALVQCFKRSGFNKENDRLIVIGDVCDGYPHVKECIDELLKIKHCDLVIGNHDQWVLDWAMRGHKPTIWTSQGGIKTIESYNGGPMIKEHIEFLQKGHLWIESNNQLFVHGGFDPDIALSKHSAQTLMWDRKLLDTAWEKHRTNREYKFSNYKDIFIGHTATEVYKTLKPIHVCNVWDIDTGAGWSGKLTIMDVDNKEY